MIERISPVYVNLPVLAAQSPLAKPVFRPLIRIEVTMVCNHRNILSFSAE